MSDEKDKKKEEELAADEESSPEPTEASAADVPDAEEAATPVSDPAAPAAAAAPDTPPQEAEPAAAPAAAPEAPAPVAAAPSMSMGAPAAAAASETPPEEASKPDIESTLTPQQRGAQQVAKVSDFYQDATAGLIKPKTYQDLYNDKNTLGKIGMLFGLMVSGAGSGLAHQPNALMEMMNKELERDFEAQKASKENRKSWYNMTMAHERMQPEIAEGFGRAESAHQKAQHDRWLNIQKGVYNKALDAAGINYSSAGALAHVQGMIDMMEPGPKKELWQDTYNNQLLTNFLAKATKRSVDAEEAKDLVNAANPNPIVSLPPPPNGVAVSGKRYAAYDQAGLEKGLLEGEKLGAEAGQVQGAIPHDVGVSLKKEAQDLTEHRNTVADAVDIFTKIDKLPNAGEAVGMGVASSLGSLGMNVLHGSSAAAHAGDDIKSKFELARVSLMQNLIGKLTKIGMPAEEAAANVKAWMPSAYDSPAERAEKFEQMKRHFSGMRAETPTGLMTYHLYYPPPNYVFKSSDKKSTAPEGTRDKAAVKMGERKE